MNVILVVRTPPDGAVTFDRTVEDAARLGTLLAASPVTSRQFAITWTADEPAPEVAVAMQIFHTMAAHKASRHIADLGVDPQGQMDDDRMFDFLISPLEAKVTQVAMLRLLNLAYWCSLPDRMTSLSRAPLSRATWDRITLQADETVLKRIPRVTSGQITVAPTLMDSPDAGDDIDAAQEDDRDNDAESEGF